MGNTSAVFQFYVFENWRWKHLYIFRKTSKPFLYYGTYACAHVSCILGNFELNLSFSGGDMYMYLFMKEVVGLRASFVNIFLPEVDSFFFRRSSHVFPLGPTQKKASAAAVCAYGDDELVRYIFRQRQGIPHILKKHIQGT